MKTIVTKIVRATQSADSMSSSLINLEKGSFAGSRETVKRFESVVSEKPKPNPHHSLNDIEIKDTEESPLIYLHNSNSFVERGTVSEGIIATLFRQSNK